MLVQYLGEEARTCESLSLSAMDIDDDFKLSDIDSKITLSSICTEEFLTVNTPLQDSSL